MASAANFILKVYLTESDAKTDSNAYDVNLTASEQGSVVNNQNQSTGYHYFSFQRYWYRIEANEPVSEFHIDWDDGEDNSPEKANVSVIKTDKPSFFGVVSHIYTQSKPFYPLVRVKSVDGFLSKWYTSHAGDGSAALNTFQGLDTALKTTGTGGLLYDKGQNSFSVVSIERNDDTTTAFARIPVLHPANVPPVGVLKTDRKRVFSGIDNVWLGNNNRILDSDSTEMENTSTVHAYCDNVNRTGVQVKVTYQEGVLGGTQEVWSVRTCTKGSGSSNGNLAASDVANSSITITTMDETYSLWWNINSQQNTMDGGTSHVAIRVDLPADSGSGAGSTCSVQALASGTESALEGVFYPSGGTTGNHRAEFTATHAQVSGGSLDYLITVTHTRPGKPYSAGVAAVISSATATPLLNTDAAASGHGTAGVLQVTAGVDASDGTTKQRTLTTVGQSTTPPTNESAFLENVYKILKAELVNNLENTDSYGGSSGATTLAPGERVFLMSSLSKAGQDANLHPTNAHRLENPNLSNTICSVSLGNPITDLNSLGSKLTADVTESKTRCSNKSISSYYLDDNKLVSGDDTGHTANHQEASATQITDVMISQADTDSKSTIGIKDLRYTFDWWRDHQDSDYRFSPVKRLIRAQVQDSHTQGGSGSLNTDTHDAFNHSPIIHYEDGRYEAFGVHALDQQPSEIAKWNYGALLFTNEAKVRSPDWVNLNVSNRGDRYPLFTPYTSHPTSSVLLGSTQFDTQTGANLIGHYAPTNVANASGAGGASTVGPRNAVFLAQKQKFDRLFIRVNHDRYTAEGSYTPTSIPLTTVGVSQGFPKMRIQVLYPAKKNANSSSIIWKTLPIVDRTKIKGVDDSSFYKSGEIMFNPPSDWEKTQHHNDNIIYPYEDNFWNDKTNSAGIKESWDKDSYALIFLITMIGSTDSGGGQALLERIRNTFNIMSIYPYNNSHSQLIEIVDPMHVSLNSFGIAQSVSFVRKGKFQEIKDRSGISQMRRIGADGGAIKLGSIDLKNDSKTTRAKFNEFQRDATPLYYDVVHKDDSRTRLFGTMTEMSEDFPTAAMTPKFSTNMKVTHILEIDSSGNITGEGYTPLGGDVIDVEQYLSTS